MSENGLLKAALWYAAHGLHVFRLAAGAKVPMKGSRGYLDATTDPATIRKWWAETPGANVGIATGPSGVIVIDVDVKDGAQGRESWGDLLAAHGRGIGDTVTSATPSKGSHLWYRLNGREIGCTASKLGEGLDVRAVGGYVVAPPSRTPQGAYAWEMGEGPHEREMANLPECLARRLAEVQHERAEPLPDAIPPGQRNATLASLAGTMRRRGASEDAILAALVAENDARCNPPLPDSELVAIAASIVKYAPGGRQSRLGDSLAKEQAELAVRTAPETPADAPRDAVIGILIARGIEPKFKPAVLLRRLDAGLLTLGWLCEHGGFVQTPEGEPFYFSKRERRLYNLETNRWAAYLYAITGANPAGPDYAYLLADCKAAALSAPVRPVLKVAAWDDDAQVLRVSRFDGTVYVLDGQSIETEPNGEAVLFAADPLWQPYTPDYEEGAGALAWLTGDLPNWKPGTAYDLAFRAWVVSMFFTELCPTRPLVVFLGEKGGGKSMVLRVLLRLLFGAYAQVSGVPDKPDGFTAAAAATHLLVLDNLDLYTGWLRDKLARIATGALDEYRRLYTSNTVGRVRYRTWLAFTARTPDTLRRDDLADRLLILPVDRIEADKLKAERGFLEQSLAFRDWFWADLLTTLNKIVAAIRQGKLNARAKLRMADWESLGRVLAQIEGQEDAWDGFVKDLKLAQGDFLLEGDLIVEGLERWMQSDLNHGREMTARQLREEFGEQLFGDRKPPSDWPRSSVGFGKRLANVRRELGNLYKVEWGEGTSGANHHRVVYTFWPLPDGGMEG